MISGLLQNQVLPEPSNPSVFQLEHLGLAFWSATSQGKKSG